MCSYGGIIAPRPHDNTLCYIGGDTRIVVINRRDSLSDFSLYLSKTFLLQYGSFVLKYQLPGKDLDTLISITTDEDLKYMIHEYDGINATERSVRLRVFLFPLKPDRVSLTGFNGFLDALKGLTSISRNVCSEFPSVNSRLGLDDGIRNVDNFEQDDATRDWNSSEDENNNEESQVINKEDQDSVSSEEEAENAIYEDDSISTFSRNTSSTRVRMLRVFTRCSSVASFASGATKSDDFYFNRLSTVTTVPISTPTKVFSDTSSVKSFLGTDDDFVNRGVVIADDDWVWRLPWYFGGRAQS